MTIKIRNARQYYLLGIVLFSLTIGAFSQVFHHPFISFDDDEYVYENPFIQSGLTQEGVMWAFSTLYAANWHPMTWLSHMMDIQLFGLDAGGHHLENVLLHATNSVLLFLALWRMTGGPWRSFFVAALFAIHPLHVESVAWVAERKDVLSTFFWVLTLWVYARYAERPNPGRYIAVAGLFVLGLLSKPMIVTLPFVLLLLDYWPLNRLNSSGSGLDTEQKFSRNSASQLIVEKIPLFVLSAASCVITYIAQSKSAAVGSLTIYPFTDRVTNALVSVMRYIGKMIWPASLSVYYPHDVTLLPYWMIFGAGILVSFLTILAIRLAKSRPYATVGWLWYLGTLFPVIGLVQVGEQAMADRYTYLPLIGIFILLTWGFHDIVSGWRFRKYLVATCMTIVISSLFLATRLQVNHWRSGIALFGHSLEVTSNNGIANNNLGKAFLDEGKFAEAIPFFREAVRIKPSLYMAYSNLGIALGRVGKTEEATAYSREALRMNPEDAGAYFGLGYALIQQGKIEEAIASYRRAFRIEPYSRFSLTNLGVDLAQQGKIMEATSVFREAIRMNPEDGYAHYNLGYALVRQGKAEESVPFFKEALRLNPGNQDMVQKLNAALNMRKK